MSEALSNGESRNSRNSEALGVFVMFVHRCVTSLPDFFAVPMSDVVDTGKKNLYRLQLHVSVPTYVRVQKTLMFLLTMLHAKPFPLVL